MNKHTPVSEKLIKFDLYIDATGDSSSRSRAFVAVLMTATFLAALALYNSLPQDYNWLTSRLRSLQNFYFWTVFPDDKQEEIEFISIPFKWIDNSSISDSLVSIQNKFSPNEIKGIIESAKEVSLKIDPNELTVSNHLKLRFPSYCFDSPKNILLPNTIDSDSFKKALNTMNGIKSASREEIGRLIYLYDRARIENSILIDIPVLGISFDVNGLAVISAVAFGIIYFLLFYSLSRERKNLTLVFKIAHKYEVDRISLYQLLSMRHVLTVPRSIDEILIKREELKLNNKEGQGQLNEMESTKPKKSRLLMSLLPFIPIVIPVILWVCIFAHDLLTTPIGNAISEGLTFTNFTLSIFFGVFMMVMFYLCYKEWNSINKIYRDESQMILYDIEEKQPKTNKRQSKA